MSQLVTSSSREQKKFDDVNRGDVNQWITVHEPWDL